MPTAKPLYETKLFRVIPQPDIIAPYLAIVDATGSTCAKVGIMADGTAAAIERAKIIIDTLEAHPPTGNPDALDESQRNTINAELEKRGGQFLTPVAVAVEAPATTATKATARSRKPKQPLAATVAKATKAKAHAKLTASIKLKKGAAQKITKRVTR